MYDVLKQYLYDTVGRPLPPSILQDISVSVLRDGLFFHCDEVPSGSGDSGAGSALAVQGAGDASGSQGAKPSGAGDLPTGIRGNFTLVSLDKPSHPDVAKIANEKYQAIEPHIRHCIHPEGRRVLHFRHELLQKLVTAGICAFLTKYPHLRNSYSVLERLSRLIFASGCGIVSLFFIR